MPFQYRDDLRCEIVSPEQVALEAQAEHFELETRRQARLAVLAGTALGVIIGIALAAMAAFLGGAL